MTTCAGSAGAAGRARHRTTGGAASGHDGAVARVAMVGAGQLARMTQQAAVDLGVELVVLAADPDDPAAAAGAAYEIGSPFSLADLERIARRASVLTLDHELVAGEALRELVRRGHLVRPGADALAFAQDKLFARSRLQAMGFPVPPFASVATAAEARRFGCDGGWPIVLKAPRGGYDGRGVHVLEREEAVDSFFALHGHRQGGEQQRWLAEEHVALVRELAVVVARRPGGESRAYPLVETVQSDGICTRLLMPAQVPAETAAAAIRLGSEVAEAIGATGICAVELFLDENGGLLVNECALRPHNSGHATIEACTTSQFHQHLRAVLDWPLGDPALVVPAAAMVNLIGDAEATDPRRLLSSVEPVPGTAVHLYGKQPRPGRKLGHVTAVGASTSEALELAQLAAERLGSGGSATTG